MRILHTLQFDLFTDVSKFMFLFLLVDLKKQHITLLDLLNHWHAINKSAQLDC